MASLCSAVLFGLLACVAASAIEGESRETPLTKVTKLLEDLKEEIEDEAKKEAKSYDEFGCFCKDTTEEKSESIKEAQDDIDDYSATIEEKTEEKDEKVEEYTERKKKHEKLSKELADEKARCDKARQEYEVEEADLSTALKRMDAAIDQLKDAKPSLLQGKVTGAVKDALDMADALGFIHTDEQKKATAFLQNGKVDPKDAEYSFHSDKIIELLEDLEKEFKENKDKLDKEWKKTKEACDKKIESLNDEIDENKEAIETLDGEIEELKTEIAENREKLVKAEDQLSEDQLYLKDLTAQCEARARDWDQRSGMRTDEIKALDKALEILNSDDVKNADDVNERAASAALLVPKVAPVAPKAATLPNASVAVPAKKPASFLQTDSARTVMKRLRSGLGVAASAAKRDRVAKMLGDEGKRLKSPALSTLSIKVQADPFAKVKDLIQSLIERLVKEATEEAKKQGFCNTELGKSKTDRDNRFTEMTKLNIKLRGLEAKEAELETEIETLDADLKELKANLEKAKKIREEEKEENEDVISKASDGKEAVGQAIEVLKRFYAKAGKASLAQVSASPVDEDTEGAGFSGSYKGNQDAATGIIGMMEVLHSDFARTVRVTTKAEAEAAAEFVEFDRQSKMDIGAKETKTTLDEQELEATKANIETGMEDMQTAQDLLDQALKEIEELKPVCIDTGMSYEERVEAREAEIKALEKALCMLDPEDVEEDC
eukprot:gnl/TRDRNA2_/TRDRNA2_132492_c0_seq5.p1 gnl/TRDRNA2_/TRDRNA2_132492_c0~~gnl/TRDRNA2_/TRDRNA2_132492_c0_seq5.p1  ORF type:complete len:720 (+),score=292.97 gnl/TRDRNA2_/TRDRNA2_132492_c0_seq5:85-2244(+)